MSPQRSSRRIRQKPPSRSPMFLVWGAVAVLVGVGLAALVTSVRRRERPGPPGPPRGVRQDSRPVAPELPVAEQKKAEPEAAGDATAERAPAAPDHAPTPPATRPVAAEKNAPTEKLSAVIDGLVGDGLVRPAEPREAEPAGAAETDAGFGLPIEEQAERTARAIRRGVAAGVAEGRHGTIHMEIAGGSKKGKVTGADEKRIQVSFTGVTVPLAWEKIDARRLYLLGREYLPAAADSAQEKARTRLRLARYCLANRLFDEARGELTRILQANPGMRDDEVLVETEKLLREEDAAAGDERAAPPVVSRKRGLTPCYKCGGTGIMHWMPCPQCDRSDRPGYCFFGEYYAICSRCNGKGKLPGIRCDTCGGRGKIDPDRPLKKERHIPGGYVACPHCAATGIEHWIKCIQCKRSDFPGYLFMGDHYLVCNRCRGTGKLPGIKCSRCKGRGMIKEERY